MTQGQFSACLRHFTRSSLCTISPSRLHPHALLQQCTLTRQTQRPKRAWRAVLYYQVELMRRRGLRRAAANGASSSLRCSNTHEKLAPLFSNATVVLVRAGVAMFQGASIVKGDRLSLPPSLSPFLSFSLLYTPRASVQSTLCHESSRKRIAIPAITITPSL